MENEEIIINDLRTIINDIESGKWRVVDYKSVRNVNWNEVGGVPVNVDMMEVNFMIKVAPQPY